MARAALVLALAVAATAAADSAAAGATSLARTAHVSLSSHRAKPGPVLFVLSRDARRGVGDVALGWRMAPATGRPVRRRYTLRIPAGLRPGTWRILACRNGTRCTVVRSRIRLFPGPVPAVLFTLPPAVPQSAPAPPAVQPPPPPAPEPPPPPADPEPPDQPPALTMPIEECGLPVASDTAPATAFTELFASARTGWTGGDGTFSARLADGRTAWLFGDSFVGGVTDDGRREPQPLERNALVIQDGDCLKTMAPVLEGADDDHWYWPSAARADAADPNVLHAFFTRIHRTGGGPLDLEVDGTVLVDLDLTTMRPATITEIPAPPHAFLGAALLDDATHTYVFGVDDPAKRVVLARTALGDLDGPYEFRSSTGWSADPADAQPLLDDTVATQLSVVPDGEDLLLVTQPPLSNDLVAWRAEGPTGPYTDRTTLTTFPRPTNAWTYNALVHPESTTEDGLLVSTNVMPDTFAGVFADASLYRPRFVRIFPTNALDNP